MGIPHAEFSWTPYEGTSWSASWSPPASCSLPAVHTVLPWRQIQDCNCQQKKKKNNKSTKHKFFFWAIRIKDTDRFEMGVSQVFTRCFGSAAWSLLPSVFSVSVTGCSCAIYGANLVKSSIQPSFVLLCPYVCFCELLSTAMTSPIRKRVC